MPLLAAALSLALAGNSVVYRCTGAHGETIFSGQPCASADNRALGAVAPMVAAPPRLFMTCPRNLDALRQRATAAFASRDGNAFGALFLWRGFGTRAAYARLRDLNRIVAAPGAVVRIDSAAPISGGEPTLVVTFDDAATDYRFPVRQQDGCAWLDFAANAP